MIDPLLAVLAGMLTVAAPCVLPILPVVLGASVGQQDRLRPIFIFLGFALSFSAVGLLFGSVSRLLGLSQESLRDFAVFMLLLFGVLMVWRAPFDWLAVRMNGLLNRANTVADNAGAGKLGGLMLGLTLGALWTPCAGPVLGSILTLLATTPDIGNAGLLLACYSLGAALPMMAIAYGGQYVTTRVRQFAHRARGVQQAFGILVILTAIAMYFQYDAVLTVWLSNFYPQAATGL
ncbi:MAG: cytochrome biosis transrane region family protein [Polaromonas sp.]|nr:cytochrome biosis transrane region family protein [Polaromonas sp.]